MARRSNATIDMEVAIVRAQLEIIQRREDEFKKLLDDMQQLKNSISAEKLALRTKELSLEAERHPINWLPAELLIHIFLVCAEISYTGDEDLSLDETYHRPPVIISHVCHNWRTIALATPSLWSCLSFRSPCWNEPSLEVFIERSGTTPLNITYRSSQSVSIYDERQTVWILFDYLHHHLARLHSITLQCQGAEAMAIVINILNNSAHEFPHLHFLNLSITTSNPSFISATSLMTKNFPGLHPGNGDAQIIPCWSRLRHLKLEEVPLFNFPTHFLANLQTLELNFPPRKLVTGGTTRYFLRVSALYHFLALTPCLEHLVLSNTAPQIDVFLKAEQPSEGNATILVGSPVRLSHLKRFDWSYPYSGDVHRVLSFFDLPALEKLDLWVEELPVKRDIFQSRGYQDAPTSQLAATHGVLELPSLRDLSLQCAGEDTTSSVLRKFVFPILEKFEVTNTDMRVRAGDIPLPTLPRLESIFRDPRLPHLTHLTISHFEISPEHGRAEAMLGYMPVLTSLSLDACIGVGRLMEGLQESAVRALRPVTSRELRRRRGVKVCPRLEALSLRGCDGVAFESVRTVVKSRNGNVDEKSVDNRAEEGRNVSSLGIPSRSHTDNEGIKMEGVIIGRKIRPLRKPRRQGPSNADKALGSPSAANSTLPTNILSMAMGEAFLPASIVYVRFEDCPSITREDALTLKDLGVVDVVCNGLALG